MNNEDFDKAIREKLESVKQTYTESDIDKVFSHIAGKRKFPFRGSAGSWLLYSLSAAAFTVVTVWTVSHFQNNNKLAFQSNKITKHIHHTTTDSTLSDIAPIDTINFKSAEKESVKGSVAQQVNSDAPIPKSEIKSIDQVPSSEKPKNAEQAKTTAVTNKTGKESIINLGRDKTQVPAKMDEPDATNAVTREAVSPTSNLILSQDIQVSSGHPEISQPSPPEATKIQKTENKKDSSVKVPDSLFSEKSAVEGNSPDTISKGKSAKIRVGTAFQLSNQSFGMGITGEMLFRNNFGFETGLIYRVYQTEHYTDQNDLFMHKHHDFNGRIEGHFSGKNHISDVSIDNWLLEIPIAIKYFVPLKKNFNIYFSLGTDLNIYLNQKLSYNYRSDSGAMGNNQFKPEGNIAPFNNLLISAGIEKQWKSLVIQLQPYIAPRLKEVFYKPKELEFGVGVGVKYSFGK